MAVITLEYDEHNALSRRKLGDLLNSGLFVNLETAEEHKKEMDMFLYNAKRNIAPFIAKYMDE